MCFVWVDISVCTAARPYWRLLFLQLKWNSKNKRSYKRRCWCAGSQPLMPIKFSDVHSRHRFLHRFVNHSLQALVPPTFSHSPFFISFNDTVGKDDISRNRIGYGRWVINDHHRYRHSALWAIIWPLKILHAGSWVTLSVSCAVLATPHWLSLNRLIWRYCDMLGFRWVGGYPRSWLLRYVACCH